MVRINLVGRKFCSCCKIIKYKSDFARDKNKKDGRSYRCKHCSNIYSRKWNKENKEKASMNSKRWHEKNRERVNLLHKKWVKENKAKHKTYVDKYRNANREKIRLANRVWKKINRDKVNAENRKRRGIPKVNIDYRMSRAINHSLHSKKEGRSWEKLVGYTTNTLMQHLEALFKDGMSWDNMKEWHIDHKIPKSLFNYSSPNDKEFKECWSLNNLQPLWAEDNLKKGYKIEKN